MTFSARRLCVQPKIALMACLLLLQACGGSSSGGSTTVVERGGEPRAAQSTVAMPTLTGPIADNAGLRGGPWAAADPVLSPLGELGYIQEEYFFSGTAEAIARDGSRSGDTADYTTRMLVARPANPDDFNGTVLVEWMNVTGEIEMDVVFAQVYREILREGYAYVAMSVQQVGVSTSPLALKFWDPVRYLPLNHPGDSYAFDMFAQGSRSVLTRGAVSPMGNLDIKRIIATGESQSAALMIPYINNVDPVHRVFDGYLVHTYPGVIEGDVAVPVLMLLSETEVEGMTSPLSPIGSQPDEFSFLDSLPYGSIVHIPTPETAPADFDRFRVWEVAGSSHFDKQALVYVSAQASRDMVGFPTYDGLPLSCAGAVALYPTVLPDDALGLGLINQFAMQRPARAALHALNDWLITGEAPPVKPRIARNMDGSILRDSDGLAVGGIRMPVMEEPIGVNEGNSCIFFGRYSQFSDAANRYASLDDYIAKLTVAAQDAVERGDLLPEEAEEYLDEAREEGAGIW